MQSRRSVVLIINAPIQTNNDLATLSYPEQHADWANYPCLGVLTLASALQTLDNVNPIYLDGAVCPFEDIIRILHSHANELLAVAVSALTANYPAALEILKTTRDAAPEALTILGNDHFTALPRLCFRNHGYLIDYGFCGNEVLGPFRRLIRDLVVEGRPYTQSQRYAGSVYLDNGSIQSVAQQPEPVFSDVDYTLIDAEYQHSSSYRRNLAISLGIKTDNANLPNGVPVELARGCIKFARNDACSFCSIQYGGLWKNQVESSRVAWSILEQAYNSGFDDLYLTADELPFTFYPLLQGMAQFRSPWDQKGCTPPRISGYARADGLAFPGRAALLSALGIQTLRIGIDACPSEALLAMNKQLMGFKSRIADAQALANANEVAVERAHEAGLRLKLSFVFGHLGATDDLLGQTLDYAKRFVTKAAEITETLDVEILSPEPGSLDYLCLIDPNRANERASLIGVELAPYAIRERLARKWRERDVIDSNEIIRDYIRGMLPHASVESLRDARSQLRLHASQAGIRIGGDINSH